MKTQLFKLAFIVLTLHQTTAPAQYEYTSYCDFFTLPTIIDYSKPFTFPFSQKELAQAYEKAIDTYEVATENFVRRIFFKNYRTLLQKNYELLSTAFKNQAQLTADQKKALLGQTPEAQEDVLKAAQFAFYQLMRQQAQNSRFDPKSVKQFLTMLEQLQPVEKFTELKALVASTIDPSKLTSQLKEAINNTIKKLNALKNNPILSAQEEEIKKTITENFLYSYASKDLRNAIIELLLALAAAYEKITNPGKLSSILKETENIFNAEWSTVFPIETNLKNEFEKIKGSISYVSAMKSAQSYLDRIKNEPEEIAELLYPQAIETLKAALPDSTEPFFNFFSQWIKTKEKDDQKAKLLYQALFLTHNIKFSEDGIKKRKNFENQFNQLSQADKNTGIKLFYEESGLWYAIKPDIDQIKIKIDPPTTLENSGYYALMESAFMLNALNAETFDKKFVQLNRLNLPQGAFLIELPSILAKANLKKEKNLSKEAMDYLIRKPLIKNLVIPNLDFQVLAHTVVFGPRGWFGAQPAIPENIKNLIFNLKNESSFNHAFIIRESTGNWVSLILIKYPTTSISFIFIDSLNKELSQKDHPNTMRLIEFFKKELKVSS